MRPRKLFIHNTVVMVSFRTEEGLPFVPVDFINEIIWSAMARGQELYPVEVCDFSFEDNHAHILLRVLDPEHVPLFVGYVKQETAHAINRLLGRRRKTVWVQTYDSPTILDVQKMLDMIAYVILNPLKDNLVSDINEYPGVNSWKMFKYNRAERKCLCISRDSVPRLMNPNMPWRENERIMNYLRAKNSVRANFYYHPYAWKCCFDETKDLSDAEIRTLMLEAIEGKISEIKMQKLKNKLPKANAARLIRQSILRVYIPRKFGRKMIC